MPAIIIVGAQWGDEGKGKIADILSTHAYLCARYGGGNNAGHTIYDKTGQKIVLHLIPVGIIHGAISIIGPGVVVHFKSLLEEIASLNQLGVSCEKLMISPYAHLVMPWHLALDEARERKRGTKQKIGTTLKGIGPCYEDKASRIYAFRVGELRDKERFLVKLATIYHEKVRLTSAEEYGQEIMADQKLFPPFEKLFSYFDRNIKLICPYIREDATQIIQQALDDRKRVVFEGAQGTLLDPDWGTYPYVTASTTVAKGAFDLIGKSRREVRVIGVAKAYVTRVGEGPFPTEIIGPLGDELRKLGHEYGATTGRPRRCGWFDVELLRFASCANGGFDELILTKLDTLGQFNEPIKLSTQYRGSSPFAMSNIEQAIPEYETFEPWGAIDPTIRSRTDLPSETRRYIQRIEELTQLNVDIISIGAERKSFVTF